MLAEEIVLFGSRERRVAVGGADDAEFIGVGAELLLESQASLQGLTRILTGKHVIGLRHGQVQIADVPGAIIGKFVIG